MTLGAVLPCLGAGCASPVISGQGTTTTTSGNKILAFFMQPKPKPATAPQRDPNDPASLFSKTAKPSPELYVTMAQLREQAGEVAEAEGLYQKALKADPKYLPALMGYAHLEDRRGNLEAATKLYKKAISKHPNEVAPYNDLGLCFHRQGKLNESVQTLHHAVVLQPDKKLYHNNLAMVLVDLDRHDEALNELSIAGSPASAHYNLAGLLHRKGDDAAALEHFRLALAEDPSMQGAQQWVAKLSPESTPLPADALAGRVRRRSAGNSEPPAPVVATDGDANRLPAAPAGPSDRSQLRPPAARPVSTRTAKADSAAEGAGSQQETAPRAPNQPQFLYSDSAPTSPPAVPSGPSTAPPGPIATAPGPPSSLGPPTVSGSGPGSAPPAPGLDPIDRLPPPEAVARTETAPPPPAESVPEPTGAKANAAAAPQAPNPPQFLYADNPSGGKAGSAPPAPELAPADRLAAMPAAAPSEGPTATEKVSEPRAAAEEDDEPQGPQPPQFLYADETPFDAPIVGTTEAAPVPPPVVEPQPDEKTKFSLATDRAAGARIVKPESDADTAESSNAGPPLSLNRPLYLHANDPEADEPLSVKSLAVGPAEALPKGKQAAGLKPAVVKPVAEKSLTSKPLAGKALAGKASAGKSLAPMPVAGIRAPDRSKPTQLKYPGRHDDSQPAAGNAAPLPGEQPQLDTGISAEDEIDNPALIVPAEPIHYGS